MHLVRQSVISLCLAFLFVLVDVQAGTPEEWKSRTIYQLLTDRFAVGGSNSKQNCWNLSNYCGGNFQGIIERLDYIQGMGFDAIWISPIPENYQGGYHGYWMTNLDSLNSNFGTAAQLSDLVEECHKRGIWVMLDVVGNHVGPVGTDYSKINPFNQAQYYHSCNGCPSNCDISDWNNQNQVEDCRLSGLPDLDQSNSFVNSTLLNWISGIMHTYGFDGIRIDTVPEVSKAFWAEYVAYAGSYAVGEVYNGDPNYVSGYQEPKGPLPGVLSYPMYLTLRDVFAYGKSMSEIESQMANYHSMFGDLSLLGTFIDNHDQARFLSQNSDTWMYKNAIAYTLMAQGIPIVYYGTEQGFNGGNDPKNREVLWTTSFATDTDLYKFIQTIVDFRKENQVWKYDQVQRYSTYNFYAFTRGNFFVALTNVGTNGNTVQYTITYHPYSNGQKLCDLFYPTDCLTVANNQFTITLLHGECKIFYPVSSDEIISA